VVCLGRLWLRIRGPVDPKEQVGQAVVTLAEYSDHGDESTATDMVLVLGEEIGGASAISGACLSFSRQNLQSVAVNVVQSENRGLGHGNVPKSVKYDSVSSPNVRSGQRGSSVPLPKM
jgi:hypothetical protein